MAKMSKAQARKRLVEARTKCAKVFLRLQETAPAFSRDLQKIMASLDKLSAKLK